jgi:hypothetical protein
VRLLDAQRVEQSAHGRGEVTKRVGLVHVLGGPAVSGQIWHHHPVPPRKRIDVAGVVRHSRRPWSAAVQQQHRIPGAALGDRDVAGTDLNEPLFRDLLLDAHSTSPRPRICYRSDRSSCSGRYGKVLTWHRQAIGRKQRSAR